MMTVFQADQTALSEQPSLLTYTLLLKRNAFSTTVKQGREVLGNEQGMGMMDEISFWKKRFL